MGSTDRGYLPEKNDDDLVAIIGMGCRWPGDSESPSELWDFLEAKQNAYSKFPPDRITTESFYHPKANRPGSFYTEGGAFLKANVRSFDHTFFGIHPKEVMAMDPAQRKFMEVVYESFESAGVPLEKLAGSKTGCFVGNFNYDHQLMHYRDAEYPEPYSVVGGGITILSNRVNYLFDLKGPSMTLDTACSSSMYALHLACTAIQSGECDGAVVGGSNLILTPECQIFSSVLGAVSPTSICHTFDASADGYARADGIGALYIKKLSHAFRDKDPIRAVIRGTAINANGRTGGITHPSPDGQEAVIRRAYERAGGLDPSLTGYFECHGTGTAVGDPLEIEAIGRVFGDLKSISNPLLIGSIKSNMGHSEPTSGIAGVMKAVIAIEKGVIPPTVGLKTLNPNINLRDGRIKIVTECTPWPNQPVRRASINSFGYGGSNAHIILESVDSIIPGYREAQQASSEKKQQVNGINGINGINGVNGTNGTNGHANGKEHTNGSKYVHIHRKKYLLPLSAHDERTLQANIAALDLNEKKWSLPDLAYTLSTRRSLLSTRTFRIVDSADMMDTIATEAFPISKKQGTSSPNLGFIFTGQGAQWPTMGIALMEEFPTYLRTIRTLDHYLDKLNDGRTWRIEDVLCAPSEASKINDAELSQPLVTATQIGLVNLLAEWGVVPSAVSGHSSGEIAAAYAAKLITAEDAIVVAYLRGKAVAENSQSGLMMAVGLGDIEVQEYIREYHGKVVVACHNSPESVTLSGDANAITEVKEALDNDKKFARLLSTGGNAYHSHHMLNIGQAYQDAMSRSIGKGSKYSPKHRVSKDVAFFSTVLGHQTTHQNMGPQYFRQNLESPVLFNQAVADLIQSSIVDILVEIGPHSALQGPIRQIGKNISSTIKIPEYMTAIVRKSNNAKDILTLAGQLFTKGYMLDLGRVNETTCSVPECRASRKIITDLPHYQWQYGEDPPLLTENRYTREWRLRKHPRHDILGSRIPGGVKDEPTWRNVLKNEDLLWLTDHRLGPDIVFPSTGYLAMALEAATQTVEINGRSEDDIVSLEVLDVSLQKALIIPEEGRGIEVLFTMRPASLNTSSNYVFKYSFVLTSVNSLNGEDSFVEHCRGDIQIGFEAERISTSHLVAELEDAANIKKDISASQWYEKFASVGLNYGPIFQGMTSVKAAGDRNLTEARIPLKPTAKLIENESRYIIHPAALDAAMQLSILASNASTATKFKRAMMPVIMESVKFFPKVAKVTAGSALSIAKGSLKGVRGMYADLTLIGVGEQPIMHATNILLIASDQHAQTSSEKSAPYTRIVWKPQFESLNDETVTALYPPVMVDDDAIIPSLNNLALHQLIHFRATHPEIFQRGVDVPHLQRMLDWTNEKLELHLKDDSSSARLILNYTSAHRQEEIERLSASLNPRSSESRLMCHLYKNLPAIYAGEKTGIQVALQDNLLLDNYETGQVYKEGNRRLASLLAILGHQKPGLKILEVGAGTGSATREILPALAGDTPWRKYVEYRFTDTTTSFLAGAEESFKKFSGLTFGAFDMEKSAEQQGYSAEWDVVIASNVLHATSDIKKTLENVRTALKPGGKLILLELTRSQLSAGLVLGTFSDFWKGDSDPHYPRFDGPFLSKHMWRSVLPRAGFTGLDFFLDDYAGSNLSATVVCATAAEDKTLAPRASAIASGLTVVYRTAADIRSFDLAKKLESTGLQVDIVALANVDKIHYTRLLFVVEIARPLFLDATPAEWSGLQICIKEASSIVWITHGSLMDAKEPTMAMISGLARGIKTENPHLQLTVVDLDHKLAESDVDMVVKIEERATRSDGDNLDAEFRLKNNITYVSRLVPDDSLNNHHKASIGSQTTVEEVPLGKLNSVPLKIAIDKPGVLSTIHFQEDRDFTLPLAEDHVEIEVVAAGVNNKDIAVLTGKHHSNTFSDECAGTISKVGSAVTDIKLGDRVYMQSFAKFGNFVRDKAIFCQKMLPEESFEAAATLPVAFCTAIYGLVDLGRLRKGESVLIQSATGAVGLAAIQIAKMCGAEIFASVGTTEKKTQLLNMGYGIAENHVIGSRDIASARSLLELTNGKGIDVILCSARGELMHEYLRCIAPQGRFIEIGRTEVLDNGKISLDVFRRNATFASFDLEVMSATRPDLIADLMTRLNQFKREGHVTTLPYKTYHLSEIDKAFMTFGKAAHIGKLVISYEHNDLGVNIRRSPFTATFDPNANYLLVGCLGGLGRSFSRWAVQRGAKNLIYLSRSGPSSKISQLFLEELNAQGVNTTIIKGNVGVLSDVQAAVASSKLPIKGVIQGALTLQDGLFESMTLEKFNATVLPRVVGTINLHEATKNSPLEFFQLWSSWTVMFGTATQSNYLASNSFMDAFARHRQSLGLPATSLSLSQVLGIGIVSYMPDYQQAMIRNGFYGNDEDEFLQFCEAGITAPPVAGENAFASDPLTQSHLLVGIEPAGLKEVDRKYPINEMPWAMDPRFTNLIQATHMLSANDTTAKGADTGEGLSVVELIRHRISRLLYVPLSDVDVGTPINAYGIDSMIAAEIRNWLFSRFSKDVSLLTMLAPTTTITTLAEEIIAE